MRVALGVSLTLLTTIGWSTTAGTQETPVAPPAPAPAPTPEPTPTPSPTPAPAGPEAAQSTRKENPAEATDQGLVRVDSDFEPDLNLNRIVVNLKDGGSLTPREPVVNMATGDIVTVSVITDEPPSSLSVEVSALDIEATITGRKRFILNFRQCDTAGTNLYLMASGVSSKDERQRRIKGGERHCPAVRVLPAGFLVLAPKDKDRGWATVTVGDGKVSRMFPVRVVLRHWNVGFSTGLVGFPSKTNEKYFLGEAKDQKAPILKAPHGELSYRLATFVNYEFSGLKGCGFSLGLASGVPSTDLAILGGVTVSLRTLPIARSARVTAGWASVTFDRLKPRYLDGYSSGTSIAASTDPAELVEKRRVNSFFFAVTFAFWDSENKFKTLMEGAK